MPAEASHNAGSFGTTAPVTVGVIIPTYNRLQFLKEALTSVLAQTYRNLDVIVLADGSSDGTVEYLASISDPRLRYVATDENLGLARKIDKGISLFPEEITWCTVVCDDDYLAPDFVAAIVGTASEKAARTIVHSQIVFVNAAGEETCQGLNAPAEESAREFIVGRGRFARDRYLTGILFSRMAFMEIGGYPRFVTGMAADDALVFTLALKDRLLFAENAIVYIRIHDEAESRQVEGLEKHLTAICQYREFCEAAARNRIAAGSTEFLQVVAALEWHALALSTHFWTRNIRQLSKNTAMQGHVRDLYRLGLERRFPFSLRVRIGALVGYLTGFCLERIGIYRSFWKKFSRVRVP